MTTKEINRYFDIYEDYIKKLISLDGNDPSHYRCIAKRMQWQDDNYVVGGLWPILKYGSEECERWPRVPNVDGEHETLVYLCSRKVSYVINVFNPKFEGRVMIIAYGCKM